jgi:hypothetical protein
MWHRHAPLAALLSLAVLIPLARSQDNGQNGNVNLDVTVSRSGGPGQDTQGALLVLTRDPYRLFAARSFSYGRVQTFSLPLNTRFYCVVMNSDSYTYFPQAGPLSFGMLASTVFRLAKGRGTYALKLNLEVGKVLTVAGFDFTPPASPALPNPGNAVFSYDTRGFIQPGDLARPIPPGFARYVVRGPSGGVPARTVRLYLKRNTVPDDFSVSTGTLFLASDMLGASTIAPLSQVVFDVPAGVFYDFVVAKDAGLAFGDDPTVQIRAGRGALIAQMLAFAGQTVVVGNVPAQFAQQ